MTALILWLFWEIFQNNEEPLPYPSSPIVRVLLNENIQRVSLSTSDDKLFVQVPGSPSPLEIQPQGELVVELDRGQFSFAGQRREGSTMAFYTDSEQLFIDGQAYTGKVFLHVHRTPDKFDVVLHTHLENYVARVVNGEMKSSWPQASLEAQAIAARSFAAYHLLRRSVRPYDLRGDARAQAFARYQEHSRCRNAAVRTQGLVLLQNKSPLLAYYVNSCGGGTRTFAQGNMRYEAVPCNYCEDSPFQDWKESIPENIVRALLGKRLAANIPLTKVSLEFEASQHVDSLIFMPDSGPALKVKGLDFRRYLNAAMGKEVVKSLRFDLSYKDRHWILVGHGWGYHGIGLCQYGAKRLGELGQSSTEILRYYYPNADIAALPSNLFF